MDPIEAAVRDPARLDALRWLELLDTPADPQLDRLTRLAHSVLRAPLALVCLVDAERQYFHSAVGLPASLSRETPLPFHLARRATGRPLAGDARARAAALSPSWAWWPTPAARW
jgi:hypothetical protein